MNERLEILANQRRHLVERSALCRLRLRRDMYVVRGTLDWKQVSGAIAAAPAARTMAWGLAMSLLGTGRAGRLLMYVSRALVIARLARAAIGYARGRTT